MSDYLSSFIFVFTVAKYPAYCLGGTGRSGITDSVALNKGRLKRFFCFQTAFYHDKAHMPNQPCQELPKGCLRSMTSYGLFN